MERIEHIDSKECKGQKTITIHLKGGNEPRLMLSPQVRSLLFYSIHIYIFVLFTHLCLFIFLCVIKSRICISVCMLVGFHYVFISIEYRVYISMNV